MLLGRFLHLHFSCSRYEVSSLKQLVSALTGGAIPLPVPVEVFYDIGQQYLKTHAHAYTLSFAPLGEIAQMAKHARQSEPSGAVDIDEQEQEKEREEKAREQAEEGATAELLRELYKQREENADLEGWLRQRESQLKEIMQQLRAEREEKQLFALQARRRDEEAGRTREKLVREMSIKSKLADALANQNSVLKEQAQLLTRALTAHEKEIASVTNELQMLESKVSTIAEQSDALARKDEDNRRKMRDYLSVRYYLLMPTTMRARGYLLMPTTMRASGRLSYSQSHPCILYVLVSALFRN